MILADDTDTPFKSVKVSWHRKETWEAPTWVLVAAWKTLTRCRILRSAKVGLPCRVDIRAMSRFPRGILKRILSAQTRALIHLGSLRGTPTLELTTEISDSKIQVAMNFRGWGAECNSNVLIWNRRYSVMEEFLLFQIQIDRFPNNTTQSISPRKRLKCRSTAPWSQGTHCLETSCHTSKSGWSTTFTMRLLRGRLLWSTSRLPNNHNTTRNLISMAAVNSATVWSHHCTPILSPRSKGWKNCLTRV